MPASCEVRGTLLILSAIGVVTSDELQRAVDQALVAAPPATDLRLLWDVRLAVTALSAEDVAWRFELANSLAARGVVSRVALLLRAEQQSMAAVSRLKVMAEAIAVPARAFTDADEARAWLEAPAPALD
jgi:hypothetical protein